MMVMVWVDYPCTGRDQQLPVEMVAAAVASIVLLSVT